MNLNLTGRTALVCGSSQGLGLATAKELALLGCRVILMARDKEKLEKALMELNKENGQEHDFAVADFSKPEEVAIAVEELLKKIGVIQILVNNTGGPAGGKVMDAIPEQFLQAFNSHLVCNHIITKHLIPGMKATGFGRIINIISTSVKQPIPGLGVSNTIRAAVANWAKTLSLELAPFGITVNNVLPGFTQTVRADYVIEKKSEMSGKSKEEVMKEVIAEIPMGRIGQPEEFGATVAFLCSPAASYISGINLPVDGGRTGCL